MMTPLRNVALASVFALAAAAANAAESTTDINTACTRTGGQETQTRVCTLAVTSATATSALKLENCDANLRVQVQSNQAAPATTSVTIKTGVDANASATAFTFGNPAGTFASTTTLTGPIGCRAWGVVTAASGDSATYTFKFMEQNSKFRVSKPW